MAGSLEPLAPNLWVATRPLKLIVGDVGTRMTVIRLADGGLFLHSPVRLDAETRAALDALGPVRWVIAPSKVHHFFVGDYLNAYPEARAYAAPGLPEKRTDLRFEAVLGDDPPPPWRGEIDQHLFRGNPTMSEIVFYHRASHSLLLTDLAFNVAADKTQGARLFYWLVGAAGRFGPHRLVRTMIRDHAAARSSVTRILEWDFDRIVVTTAMSSPPAGASTSPPRLRFCDRRLGVTAPARPAHACGFAWRKSLCRNENSHGSGILPVVQAPSFRRISTPHP